MSLFIQPVLANITKATCVQPVGSFFLSKLRNKGKSTVTTGEHSYTATNTDTCPSASYFNISFCSLFATSGRYFKYVTTLVIRRAGGSFPGVLQKTGFCYATFHINCIYVLVGQWH